MEQALADLKVLDLSWVIAGPLCTKVLAEHGATVVRVESMQRMDVTRADVLFANGVGLNRCALFASNNNDKYAMALNVKHRSARPVVERLVRWADIVIENFRPGTLEGWRLGYGELREINPAIIVLRASLFGQEGPYASRFGFGTTMQALPGIMSLVGWPEGPPVGTPVPYTDFIAPWFAISLLMAALEHRRETGEGQCIDLSQMECALQFISPTLVEAAANNRNWGLRGNRHPQAAPHGVFRCKGDDRWCAIAVFEDVEWQGLCRVIGSPRWTKEQRFATLSTRKQHEDELEQLIEAWTVQLPPETVMARLQAEGVPAGLVSTGRDLHEDPQLAHREHFVRLSHQEMGNIAYDAPSFRLSETPAKLHRPSPCLGEHTEFVCREILGMSDEEFVGFLSEGIFE